MKVTKKTTVDGNWAKANTDIKDGDRVKIMDAGRMVEGDYGPRQVFKIMTTSREEFNMSFNQTSMNNLVDAWGDETEKWVEKIVKAWVVKQRVGDALKNVIYLAPDGWTMSDDGKFVNPDAPVEKEYPKDDINPDDIPF